MNCTDVYGWTPLHWACKFGDVDMVRLLISEFLADTTLQDWYGSTPLHVAAFWGKETVAFTLITEFSCNPTTKDLHTRSLLHNACRGGCLTLGKLLIRDYNADINAQDDKKDTPLHLAAREGRENLALALITKFGCDTGRILLHTACYCGCLTLAQLLIHDYSADINAQDEDKSTPLYLAVKGKDLALALINEFRCDLNVRNKNGDTVFHCACAVGLANIVKSYGKHIPLLATNNDGDTPLHRASANGKKECVRALLPLNPPIMLRNAAGKTARDVAILGAEQLLDAYIGQNQDKIYAHYDKIIQQAKKKYSNAEHITRIFVIGNSGSGKSSFVETMKRENFFESLSKVSESSVPLHTAGIVPSIHASKHYGRVLFYDFAGDPEYYSSHAAILENLASSNVGDNIFIIVVNLREDRVKIENTLHHWLSFIQHQNFMSIIKSILIIGSHSDLLTKEILDEKRDVIEEFSKSVRSCDIDYYSLDCRKPWSKQIEEIRGRIIHLTKDSPHYTLSSMTNALLGLLEKDFSNVTACSAQTILPHIKVTGISLPKNITSLIPLSKELHDLGLIFTIGDRRFQIVLNISQLTNEVHKLLFSKEALKASKQAVSSFNIGILPQSLLDKLLPPHITKECLVQLQYCQEISQQDLGYFPSLTQLPDSSSQSFLFFPALCTLAKSDVSWVTPPTFNYSIGWLARCADTSCDYFPPRFLHVLLLRLIFRFTLTVPHQTETSASPDNSHLK